MTIIRTAAVLTVLVCCSLIGAGPASAHRDGCHAQHSCPSDTGSYVCGDTGNYSECPAMGGSAYVSSVDPAYGKTLSGSVSWYAAPESSSYQWTRGGQPIPGATTASYTIGADDMGQTLVLTATGTDGRNQTASVSSNAIQVPALSGTAKLNSASATVGTTLSTTAQWNAPATMTYQWRRAGVAIAGATLATYLVTRDDIGQPITLDVTGMAGSSTATAATAAITPTARVTLRLTGPSGNLRAGRVAKITGTATSSAPVAGLKLTVRVWHREHGRWRLKRTATAAVSATGAFAVHQRLGRTQAGQWRAQATLAGAGGYLTARSPMRAFNVRPGR